MASAFEEALKKFRKRLIAREGVAFRELLDGYELAALEIRKQIKKLSDAIAASRTSGMPITRAQLAREKFLKDFLSEIEKEIKKYGGTVGRVVSREQRTAALDAIEEAEETAGVSVRANFSRRTVENAVGMMGDGSPIAEYWNSQVAPAVASAMREEIVKAAIFGTPFDRIARRLTAAGDITRQRALSFARTEVNRVRRETTRQTYQENSDRIKGWEWLAVQDERTCPVCLALDGQIFALEEPFPNHINCRCRMIAVLRHRPPRKRKLAREWFAEQPDEVKEKILGKHAFEAYKRGEVTLDDFVGWKTSKEFGKSVYRRSLAEIMNKGSILRGHFFASQHIKLYDYTPSGNISGQMNDASCTAASVKMLLEDHGIALPEAYLRDALKTDKHGTFLRNAAKTLNDEIGSERFRYKSGLKVEDLKNSPLAAIVSVRITNMPPHALVVDSIDKQFVYIRDPLPVGIGKSYAVAIDDFIRFFKGEGVIFFT